MDIAATVGETARGLLISPAPRTNRCWSFVACCRTLKYSHPPQKACFEDRNDHSVLGSRFQVRPWLLRPVQWLHSPNNVPYCAAEVDLVMGCGSTDLVWGI